MPDNWSPLFYVIFTKMLIQKISIDPEISKLNINPKCVVNKLVKTFPNPNDLKNKPKEFSQVLLSCSNTDSGTDPFDTKITSSWNQPLIENLKQILPNMFSIPSNIDLDCVVNSIQKQFPDPNEFTNYAAKAQNEAGDSPKNPPLNPLLLSDCKKSNLMVMITIAILVVAIGFLAYFLYKRRSMEVEQIPFKAPF